MLHTAQGKHVKLNVAERWLVNSPARAFVQRFYEIPLLRKLGGRVDGGHVLEVGCGRGVGLPLLLREFGAKHVSGVDLDPQQLIRARRRLGDRYAGQIELYLGSVEQLPFQDCSFDAVFDFGILHHAPAWQDGVAEVARVLKPGGRFFFEEVTRAALERWSYRMLLKHPDENRFSEAEFLHTLNGFHLRPNPEIHHVFFDDIFIGVAERY